MGVREEGGHSMHTSASWALNTCHIETVPHQVKNQTSRLSIRRIFSEKGSNSNDKRTKASTGNETNMLFYNNFILCIVPFME